MTGSKENMLVKESLAVASDSNLPADVERKRTPLLASNLNSVEREEMRSAILQAFSLQAVSEDPVADLTALLQIIKMAPSQFLIETGQNKMVSSVKMSATSNPQWQMGNGIEDTQLAAYNAAVAQSDQPAEELALPASAAPLVQDMPSMTPALAEWVRTQATSPVTAAQAKMTRSSLLTYFHDGELFCDVSSLWGHFWDYYSRD